MGRRKKARLDTDEPVAEPSVVESSGRVATAAAVQPSPVVVGSLPRHLVPPQDAGSGWQFNSPVEPPTGALSEDAALTGLLGWNPSVGREANLARLSSQQLDREYVRMSEALSKRRVHLSRRRAATISPAELCTVSAVGEWAVNTGEIFFVFSRGIWRPCLVGAVTDASTRVLLLEKGSGRLHSVGEPFEVERGWQNGDVLTKEEFIAAAGAELRDLASASRRVLLGEAPFSSGAQMERALRAFPDAFASGDGRRRFPVVSDFRFPPLPQFGSNPHWPENGFRMALDTDVVRRPEQGYLDNTPAFAPPGATCAYSGAQIDATPDKLSRLSYIGRQRKVGGEVEFELKSSLGRRRERGLVHLEFLWIGGGVDASVGQYMRREAVPLAGAKRIELLLRNCVTPAVLGEEPDEDLREGGWWVSERGVITARFYGETHRLIRLPARGRLFPVPAAGVPLSEAFTDGVPPYGVVLRARHAVPGSAMALRCARGPHYMGDRLRIDAESIRVRIEPWKRKREDDPDEDITSDEGGAAEDEADAEEGAAGTDRKKRWPEVDASDEDAGSDGGDDDEDLTDGEDGDEEKPENSDDSSELSD
eukprot:TRINITY_DN19952_c0_g1_i1.p1 TRINITY_DN19952_c0_g1~~TRINITY_DN19952_c0_g1_i1.p1  ORF type:complete len:592 (+),score=190.13 TRINITY_DN19952_c0_g1_i1:70-1845(+)